MRSHWTEELTHSLSTGRITPTVRAHLDALLLWVSNPRNPRADELDRAIRLSGLGRLQAMSRAYRLLDALLFSHQDQASPETLGLPPTADPDQAKRRYRRLVQVYHPDHHPDRADWATQRTERINRAFATYRKRRTQEDPSQPQRHPPKGQGATTPTTGEPGSIPEVIGARIAATRVWLNSQIQRLSQTQKRLLGAMALSLLIAILAPAIFHETPKPIPKIIHHPLHMEPSRTLNASPTQPPEILDQAPAIAANPLELDERKPATAPPDIGQSAPLPDATPDVSQAATSSGSSSTVSSDLPAEPQPGNPDQMRNQLASTDEPSGPTSEATTSRKSPEPTSEIAPDVTQPRIDETTGPLASQPPPQTTSEPPGESGANTETAPGATAPPSVETADQPSAPREPSPWPQATPTPSEPPHQDEPLAPTLGLPPIDSPSPPRPPAPPEPPLQISAASAASPLSPNTAPEGQVCESVPQMLRRFQLAYQSGSLKQLMALYSPHAKENALANWFAIRQTYDEWFKKTSARRIRFEQIHVQPIPESDRCAAAAIFQVSYRDAQSLPVTKTGVIQILFDRDGSELAILRVRY